MLILPNIPLIGGRSSDVPAGGTPAVDPFISTVVLLLNPSGADASTTVTDESPAAHGTAGILGNAQIDTGVTDAGNPTMLFDGTGDVFRWGDSADWSFGSGTFWVEARIRFNSTTGQQFIVAQWQTAGSLAWVLSKDGSGNLAFNYSTNGTNNTAVTGTWAPSTGTFYDVAVSRDASDKIRLFVNGSMVGSSTPGSFTFHDPLTLLGIGSNSNASGFTVNGWISRVRINKGSDRGIGDGGYTPQAAGYFPTS